VVEGARLEIGEGAEIGGDATRSDATLPCDSVRTTSAAKTHDFRDSRGSGASTAPERRPCRGHRRTPEPCSEQVGAGFLGRFDAQASDARTGRLVAGRVENNSRTATPKHRVKPTTTMHQNTGQNS
jgi:hypothetical protein